MTGLGLGLGLGLGSGFGFRVRVRFRVRVTGHSVEAHVILWSSYLRDSTLFFLKYIVSPTFSSSTSDVRVFSLVLSCLDLVLP